MNKYTFLYKENNTDDRDAVKYTELNRLNLLECGHYFPQIRTQGACFGGSLKIDEIDFDNITSVLNKEEFEKLAEYNARIEALGYGLDKQPEKQEQAHAYFEEIKHIINKLKSKENEELFEQVKAEELELVAEDLNISTEEAQKIFEEYGENFQDRAIIGTTYADLYELGEEIFELYDHKTPQIIRDYIDFEGLGERIMQDDCCYFGLEDGRIIFLNY